MVKKNLKISKYISALLLGLSLFIILPSCINNFIVQPDSSQSERTREREAKQPSINHNKYVEDIISNLPSKEAISKMPVANHPHLLASNQRFDQIVQQIKTERQMALWFEQILSDAEQFIVEKPPIYELENSIGMILISKQAIKRIETLGIAYKLSKEQRYLDRVWQELQAISQFPDWNPSHFLDTAEMTFAFAIAYDWLFDEWNDDQKFLIYSNIIEKGLKPAIEAYNSDDEWWPTAKNNWNQVCNGGIGVGALAIADTNPQIASAILSKVINNLPFAMKHYAPDGAWEEGLSYWHYGTSYNVALLDALETSLGSDFGLSEMPGFAQTGFFPLYGTGASGYPFNFADGKNQKLSYPELFWLSKKFNQPVFAEFQQRLSIAEPLDLIWYQDSSHNYLEKLPLDRYFRDPEMVTMRSSWEDPFAVFIGFKGGDNNASHSHLDLGSFVFDALGIRWAMDLGKDKYGLPGYFDTEDRRWTYYRMRSEGQNTIVVNPDRSPGQGLDAKANIKQFATHKNRAYAVADLTSAYAPEVSRLIRGVALQNKRQQILIQDEINANTPTNLWWFMHTRAKIKLDRNDRTAILYQGGVQLGMKILSPTDAHFEILPAEPLPNSPNPQGQLENKGVKKVAINLKEIKNATLSVVLIPLNKNENLPKINSKLKSLSKW